jgi:hypothetical protein
MKSFYHILFTVFFISLSSNAQNLYPTLHDQSGGIGAGYGSWGAYNIIQEPAVDVVGKGTITFYHPDIAVTQLGTVFFISGWGRDAATYQAFFHFMASRGYAVVNIYNTNPSSIIESYANSLVMMQEAAIVLFPDWIDTSKVGLMGHSYGAGSTIWIGKKIFGETYNWGTNGRFIFLTAPWLSFLVDKDDLQNYPANVKLLIEINNDDETVSADYTWNTDERAIRAVYELINISDDDKDFIRVFSDPATFEYDGNTYSYEASHYVSYTGATDASYGYFRTYDAMDVFAINRLSHALIDYVFEGVEAGRDMALGNGNALQTDMGDLTDLAVTDAPVITRLESEFKYQCTATSGWGDPEIWKLQDYCMDSNNDGVIDYLSIQDLTQNLFSLYPVPTSSLLNIRFISDFEIIDRIEITDMTGKRLNVYKQPNSYSIDVSNLKSGTYFVKVITKKHQAIQKIIIE